MEKKDFPKAFDIIGNIAVVRFPSGIKISMKEKKEFADSLLKNHKPVKTVLEKVGKVKGRLRKYETRHLSGEKTKEALYRENNCAFRLNIDKTYFSPRLSNERKELSQKIRNGDSVLVMFAGVGPFSIVIAKNSKARRVVSNEINRDANKYAELNVELNKIKDKVVIFPGNIKRIAEQLKKEGGKFEAIVMPRPQLKESFLEQAFSLSKRGTRVYYYGFCNLGEERSILEDINLEARKSKKNVKILGWKHAGEIAPYKFRVRVDFEVL